MKRIALPAFLILIGIAVYLPALKFDFVMDDVRQIEIMQSRFTWSQIPSYFTTDVWSYVDREKTNYYRPVFVVWMMLTYQIAGLSHPLWHASAILLNSLAVLLLYFLALRLTGDRITAAIAALMFAVYPVHLEAVAWVSGATEPLCAIFFFATLLSFIAARQETDPQRAKRFRWGSVVLFTLAIFSKETSAVLPVLIFAYAWLFPDAAAAEKSTRSRTAFSATLSYLQILLVYFAMRFVALGSFSPRLAMWPLKWLLLTLPVTAWFYIRELLWPFNLTIFPPVEAVHPGTVSSAVLPAILTALALAALWWIARRNRLAAFSTLILVLAILPVFNLRAFAPEDFVHDRYLYIPSAGFCILLAIAFTHFTAAWKTPARAALILPIVLVLGFFTIRESQPWSDPMTLAHHAVEMAPHSQDAEGLLSSALLVADRYAEALPILERALASHPNDKALRLVVASCYLRTGNPSEAASRLKALVAIQPESPQAHLLLGMAESQIGQIDNAEFQMREAVRLRPHTSSQFSGYRVYLAELLERKGDLQGALDEYNHEFDEYPGETWVFDRMLALRKQINPSH